MMLLLQFGCDRAASPAPKQSVAVTPDPVTTQVVPLTNMVLIKAGTFVRQKHSVRVTRDYWLGKYEVTQGEYGRVMGKNPSHFKDDPNQPVEKVSYFDAMGYCYTLTQVERKAGRLPANLEYRLPTEAEWEYACRAGTTNLFSFGNSAAEADRFAWTAENSGAATHPVGQKLPNPWGLHDMHGNIWEWCLDWFAEYPAADTENPVGPEQGKFKVFRGGGWNNDVDFARSANRFVMAPARGIFFVGFRVALCQILPASASRQP
jgi:eukaryotic-like serine/threonine-protein kinase